MLHTVAHIVAYFAFVVDPRYTERENTIGDAKALNQVYVVVLWTLVVQIFDGIEDFFDSLMIFRFIGEAALEIGQNLLSFHFENVIIGNRRKITILLRHTQAK